MSLPTDSASWAALLSRAWGALPQPYLTFKVPSQSDYAALFDHTLLKTDATPVQVDRLCEEARTYQFKVQKQSTGLR